MRSRNSLIVSVYFGSDREIDDTGLAKLLVLTHQQGSDDSEP